jgi:hypothetical protein
MIPNSSYPGMVIEQVPSPLEGGKVRMGVKCVPGLPVANQLESALIAIG